MPDALADADNASEHWEVAAVLAGGDSPKAGGFKFFVADQRWVWSDDLARMHGYKPGQVQPSTELLLSHKHPDDRASVADLLGRVQQGGLFSSRHRIIDTRGKTHWVVVVSDHLVDQGGQIIGTQGYYIDVTAAVQADVPAEVQSAAESRAVIDQAKGVLMAAYGVDADRAFEFLRWRSQTTGVKLKKVAAHLLEALADAEFPTDLLALIDHLLLVNEPDDDMKSLP